MAFTPPYYPIVYVRGYAPTKTDREDTFHDLYYGYAETSVESRPKPPSRQPLLMTGFRWICLKGS